jgi:hypothetical protein
MRLPVSMFGVRKPTQDLNDWAKYDEVLACPDVINSWDVKVFLRKVCVLRTYSLKQSSFKLTTA